MTLNSDFSKRIVLDSEQMAWVASPVPGVERRMLDRIGEEVARATTIVRFAPDSQFSAHTHGGGEEYIVLEGVFQDETGDFPAGTYVRNPPTSHHTPGSAGGCTIFVKLWQFDPDDRAHVRVEMGKGLRQVGAGVSERLLHQDARERVVYQEWEAGQEVSEALPGGAEILVLSGEMEESGDRMARHAWLRCPEGHVLRAKAGPKGVKLWMKTGHLPFAKAPDV